MNSNVLSCLEVVGQVDGESFLASELQTVGWVAVLVLQWNYAHADQVTAMNTLKTLRKNRSHTLHDTYKEQPTTTTSTVLRPFVLDYPGESVPEG